MTAKIMSKPLGIAALLGLLVLTGCGADDTNPSVTDNRPEVTTSASPSPMATNPVTMTQNGTTSATINTDKVEVPEEVVTAYGKARTQLLPETANKTVLLLDSFADLQKPGADIPALEKAWKGSIGAALDPDTRDELWTDIADEDGSGLVPVWSGDETVTVDGTDYIVSGQPWVLQYGEPLIEDNPDEGDPLAMSTVKYSQIVRSYIPVKDAAGAEHTIATDRTRAIDFLPGYEGQEWIVKGIWASEASDFVLVDGGAA